MMRMNCLRGWAAAVLAVASLWPFHTNAAVYRCTSPGKPDSYQGTPCAGGAAQAVVPGQAQPASDVRVQPNAGFSREQRVTYDGLLTDYFEMFGVLGRAKTCDLDPKRVEQTLKDLYAGLERRHGKDVKEIGNIIIAGMVAGAENRIRARGTGSERSGCGNSRRSGR
jgi:hypothetical protein